MGRIKDLNSALPAENDAFVFDGSNGTKKLSYSEFKQKLTDDGFGSGSSEAVVLTQAEYDALTDEEKDSDTIFFISDAPFENSNIVPCTRAEYNAMSTATKMDGRFYYVTDDAEVDTSLIVDNLTTDDAGYALSAKQGKVLNDSLSSVNEYELLLNYTDSHYLSRIVWRVGNTITAVLNKTNSTETVSNGSLAVPNFVLPVEYRPPFDVVTMCVAQDGKVLNFAITASGQVAGWLYTATAGQIFASISYCVGT